MRSTCRPAFTILELMIVVAIMAVLMSILLPTTARVRELARRVQCQSNIAQLIKGATMRAVERPSNPVLSPNPNGGDDSLAFLIPKYVPDERVAICPSTENSIRPDMLPAGGIYPSPVKRDLVKVARDGRATFGHSYELWGWYDHGIYPNGKVVDSRRYGSINTQLGLQPGEAGYDPTDPPNRGEAIKRLDRLIDGDRTILILDSDQDSGSDVNRMNNWPEEWNNHGRFGVNIGFCDGHVSWVPRGPELIETYLNSYGGTAQSDAFTLSQHPRLRITTESRNGTSFRRYTILP